jgi:putative YphP/YqiW family bacilliredoxin
MIFGQSVDDMRDEVKALGFYELKTVDSVHKHLKDFSDDKFFLFINSTCANSKYARELLQTIIKEKKKSARLYTVFAGQDIDATQSARKILKIKPSSPAFYLVDKGKVIKNIDRDNILEGKKEDIEQELKEIIDILK